MPHDDGRSALPRRRCDLGGIAFGWRLGILGSGGHTNYLNFESETGRCSVGRETTSYSDSITITAIRLCYREATSVEILSSV